MKKIIGIITVLLFTTFSFMSCEKEPPIPACESGKVGTVDVYNSTGYNIMSDVTWGDVVENYEAWINNGSHKLYSNVPAIGHPQSDGGTIEIWVSFDGDDWYFEYENLSPCEDMNFTWYLNARKSTGLPFDLMVNGITLEAKRSCDHPTKSKTWESMK